VEVCGGVQAVKYIHGYVYKGEGSITLHVAHNPDEIGTYLTARYIGSVQAAWGIFAFPIHQEMPTVYRLPVHLPNEQRITWQEGATIEALQEAMRLSVSKLTAFFRYNTENPGEPACLYERFPWNHVFVETERRWKLWEQQIAIGRMYHANPISGERFFLRLLLTVVQSSKSYEELRTVNGVIHETFHAACYALGLLEDDREWIYCFNEGVVFARESSLRQLYALALVYEGISHPLAIWEQFRVHFCDDITPQRLERLTYQPGLQDPHFDYGLYLIERQLKSMNKTLADFYLPRVIHRWVDDEQFPRTAHIRQFDRTDESQQYDG
jgi:hypothetical protein